MKVRLLNFNFCKFRVKELVIMCQWVNLKFLGHYHSWGDHGTTTSFDRRYVLLTGVYKFFFFFFFLTSNRAAKTKYMIWDLFVIVYVCLCMYSYKNVVVKRFRFCLLLLCIQVVVDLSVYLIRSRSRCHLVIRRQLVLLGLNTYNRTFSGEFILRLTFPVCPDVIMWY